MMATPAMVLRLATRKLETACRVQHCLLAVMAMRVMVWKHAIRKLEIVYPEHHFLPVMI